jgi:hypothetical protein
VDGVIGRFAPSDLVVVSVDGEPVSAHLGLPPSTL